MLEIVLFIACGSDPFLAHFFQKNKQAYAAHACFNTCVFSPFTLQVWTRILLNNKTPRLCRVLPGFEPASRRWVPT